MICWNSHGMAWGGVELLRVLQHHEVKSLRADVAQQDEELSGKKVVLVAVVLLRCSTRVRRLEKLDRRRHAASENCAWLWNVGGGLSTWNWKGGFTRRF